MRQKDWVIATALTLLLFVSFPAFSYGLVPPRTLLNKLSEGKYLTNKALWFDQTLDHFSPYVSPSLSFSLEAQFSVHYSSLCFFNSGKLMLLCVKKVGCCTAGSPTIPAALL